METGVVQIGPVDAPDPTIPQSIAQEAINLP
jgi:hypothetical protein